MSLWVHLLDMATIDCNLDLIEAFVAKMFEILSLGAWTSLHGDVSFVQLFIGFFEPLCVYPLCYEF
jgi:hypothetical protein